MDGVVQNHNDLIEAWDNLYQKYLLPYFHCISYNYTRDTLDYVVEELRQLI